MQAATLTSRLSLAQAAIGAFFENYQIQLVFVVGTFATWVIPYGFGSFSGLRLRICLTTHCHLIFNFWWIFRVKSIRRFGKISVSVTALCLSCLGLYLWAYFGFVWAKQCQFIPAWCRAFSFQDQKATTSFLFPRQKYHHVFKLSPKRNKSQKRPGMAIVEKNEIKIAWLQWDLKANRSTLNYHLSQHMGIQHYKGTLD